MKIEDLKDKKILIVGYGVEGHETEKFLKHHFPNATIGIADKSQGENYLDVQSNYDLVIKSPGIHKSKITIPYTTATNIFFANIKNTTIGVTGSKGKSTTASLIYAILKHAGKKVHLLGNITHKLDDLGKPLLSELTHNHGEDEIFVCELSSHQLDDLEHSPHIAVFTSFFPEHMDFHGSVENYFNAKKNIIQHSTNADYFIYNPHFDVLKNLTKETKATSIPFTKDSEELLAQTPLLGEHNKDNMRAAITVAKLFNVPDDKIAEAFKNFKSLPHRLEKIGPYKGLTFYDDAISTTPQSTIKAIESIPNISTLFLGGQDRGFDFTELAKVISTTEGIHNLVIFPESGGKILSAIQELTKREFTILRTKDMEEAVIFAYKNSPTGTSVTLSTGSPSYSVWKNFEEKGNLFKEFVRKHATDSIK